MKIIPLLLCVVLTMGVISCNDEWKDELFVKSISFEKCGVTKVYLRYDAVGGIIPYKIPVLVSGSTSNNEDIRVSVVLDVDTLIEHNIGQFNLREDLFYKLLDPVHYESSFTTVIPKGKEVGLIDIQFKLDHLDMVEKYILPLQIGETSAYAPNQRKHYRRTLMEIVPFNDYSGEYQSTTMEIRQNGTEDKAQIKSSREARVVNEKTIFFYAGITEDNALDREKYKIFAEFNENDGTVTLTAADPAINFVERVRGTFIISKDMNPIKPYEEVKNIILTLEYSYDDISIPGFPITYDAKGTMTLERRKNILIPDEDQPGIF